MGSTDTSECEDSKIIVEDKWARINCTIRPNNLKRLDALVKEYPFRSRSEAVEIALELLFDAYEKRVKDCQ